MNLKLIILSSIAIALVVAPLVAAAPMLGQNAARTGTQNGNVLNVQDQQQLQTGACTCLGACNANAAGVAIQGENCTCTQEQECLQANNCTNNCACNGTTTGNQFRNQTCQQECTYPQNLNSDDCNDNCNTTQQQYSYNYQRQYRHRNNCP